MILICTFCWLLADFRPFKKPVIHHDCYHESSHGWPLLSAPQPITRFTKGRNIVTELKFSPNFLVTNVTKNLMITLKSTKVQDVFFFKCWKACTDVLRKSNMQQKTILYQRYWNTFLIFVRKDICSQCLEPKLLSLKKSFLYCFKQWDVIFEKILFSKITT